MLEVDIQWSPQGEGWGNFPLKPKKWHRKMVLFSRAVYNEKFQENQIIMVKAQFSIEILYVKPKDFLKKLNFSPNAQNFAAMFLNFFLIY